MAKKSNVINIAAVESAKTGGDVVMVNRGMTSTTLQMPGAILYNPLDGSLSCDCKTYQRKLYCSHLLTFVSGKPENRKIDYQPDAYSQVDRLLIPLFRNWFYDNQYARASLAIQRAGETNTLLVNGMKDPFEEFPFDPVIDIWLGDCSYQVHFIRELAIKWAAAVIEQVEPILDCQHPEHSSYLSEPYNTNPMDERVHRDFWSFLQSRTCWRCLQRDRLLVPDDAPF